MIKYAHIKVGVATTDYSRFTYFNNVKFNVGGHVYSFQDWENGILRGNRKAPYVVGLQFDQNDPRLAFMVKNQDCRIHFGLNCGARSCPPVRNFTADNLQEELKVVATAYCEDSTSIQLDPKNNTMHLSQIFSWYRIDFVESKNQLPKALSKYLRGTKQQKLDRMLEGSSSVKVQFTSYDWSNNSRTHVPFDVETLRATKMGLKFLVKSLIGRNSQQEVQAH